ncbi:MAG: TrbC/VirB2 family protein [Elusimicrobiota bacterium]
MRKQKNMRIFLLIMFAVILFKDSVFAAYGGEIQSSLDKVIGWVTTVLGVAAVTFGLVWTGIKMSMGDEHAWQNGLKIIGGGILIFLAKPLVDLLISLVK